MTKTTPTQTPSRRTLDWRTVLSRALEKDEWILARRNAKHYDKTYARKKGLLAEKRPRPDGGFDLWVKASAALRALENKELLETLESSYSSS